MAEATQVRQGDVFLDPVAPKSLPKGLRPVARDSRGRLVLAEGEVTGHAHAILDADAVLYEAAGVVERYLEVKSPVTLRHEEHGAITLVPGWYVQRPQWEYDEAEERRVLD